MRVHGHDGYLMSIKSDRMKIDFSLVMFKPFFGHNLSDNHKLKYQFQIEIYLVLSVKLVRLATEIICHETKIAFLWFYHIVFSCRSEH